MEKVSALKETKQGIWLDPRSKLILLASANLTIMIGAKVFIEAVVVFTAAILLILFKKKSTAITFISIYIAMLLGEIFLVPITKGVFAMISSLIFIMLRKFIPCLIVGALIISTTKVSEFIAAMEKIKLSEKVIIPFAVMFRFFPTVKEEWEAIKDAMKIRGIGITFKRIITSPLKTVEYMFVPLIVSTVKIGEELSAAALSRGLDGNGSRTNISRVGFSLYDYILIIGSLGFLIFAFFIGRGLI